MFATTLLGFTISTIWAVVVLIAWILIALWPASIASRKGYSFLGFFLISLFFWWITLFVAFFMPDKAQAAAPAQPKE